MPHKCPACPFAEAGNLQLRNNITNRLLITNQLCHHPQLKVKAETHLCRGARDWQLEIFTRLGVLPETSDVAWDTAQGKLNHAATP
jgi:hypothetical protein